ncbi:MAG: hypothetical protein QM756_36785 [Polyangiaceae bacterium]
MRISSTLIALASLSVSSAGCLAPKPPEPHVLALRVESDPGVALAGARVVYQGANAGSSDEQGLVKLSVQGAEGSVVNLGVECPEGHRSPAPLSLVLRRSARAPEYSVRCAPLFRSVVVALRAEHGPELPILQLGREVGRTNRSGAAHVLLKSAPEETLELTLDTSQNPALRPRNPTTRFRVGQADDLLVFNQTFSVDKPKPVRAARPTQETGPIRIR